MIVHPDKHIDIDIYPASCFFGLSDADKITDENLTKFEEAIEKLAEEIFIENDNQAA